MCDITCVWNLKGTKTSECDKKAAAWQRTNQQLPVERRGRCRGGRVESINFWGKTGSRMCCATRGISKYIVITANEK